MTLACAAESRSLGTALAPCRDPRIAIEGQVKLLSEQQPARRRNVHQREVSHQVVTALQARLERSSRSNCARLYAAAALLRSSGLYEMGESNPW